MAINVTLPLAAPTGISTTLVAGGSLEASTTYYYVMIAYSTLYISPAAVTINPYHSPLSAEGTFTTDATDKSAKFNWTNSTGHTSGTRYEILITKTSGVYCPSNSVGTKGGETLDDTITDGTTGFTVTVLQTGSTHNKIIHSIQLLNPLLFGIDKSLGLIRVDLDGGTNTLDDIYDAIVAAGFSAYVHYDGYHFALKGWITTSGSTAGLTHITKKVLYFIKGGVHCASSAYIVRFGTWLDDVRTANYEAGCHIDSQNSRWSFKSGVAGMLQVYGSRVSLSQSVITQLTETQNSLVYIGPSSSSFLGVVDSFKDSMFAAPLRGYTGSVRELKFEATNDYGTSPHYRCRILTTFALMPYSATGRFYECDWQGSSNAALSRYSGAVGHFNYQVYFYNNNWARATNNMPPVNFSYLTATGLAVNSKFHFLWEMAIRVIDEDGDPIEDAILNLKDKDGNAGTWIEYNTASIDKDVTGNEFTTDRLADSNGWAKYYVLSTIKSLDPAYTTIPTSTEIITDAKYPYTITVSKAGYETQTIYIENFTDRVDSICVLKNAHEIMISNQGPVIRVNPENAGADRELLILP